MNTPLDTGAAERRAVRRVQQLAEIVALIECGQAAKAVDLTRLHLSEFPDDASIIKPLTGAPTPHATSGEDGSQGSHVGRSRRS